MNIVENSYYKHNDFGLVKVVAAESNEVLMERVEKTKSAVEQENMRQSVDDFITHSEVADVVAEADVAKFELRNNN